MNDPSLEKTFRIALGRPEAWACLTDHQRRVVDAYAEEHNVSAVARRLGLKRQAVQKALRLAANKFLDFAKGANGL